MGASRVYSRTEIEQLIAAGSTIVISHGRVLQLDEWLHEHPGGKLAIQHMVGRDATDEISIYHSPQTLRTMHKYRIGRISGTWINFTPPIRGGVFHQDTPANNVSTATVSTTTNVDPGTTSGSCPSHNSPIDKSHKGTKQQDGVDNSLAVKLALVGDVRDYPSVDRETQQKIVSRYRELHYKIKTGGFYDCPYREYAKESLRYASIFALFLVGLKAGWYITSAAFLGLFWHQIMFTAHDAGHRGITHNYVIDSLIGMFIADLCCGLSIGWWKSSHNVHHLVTNHHEHDPDIQNTPLFAISPSCLESFHSSYYNFTFLWDKAAELIIPYQRYTYYPVMGIARFNLYILSWCHILSPRSSGLGTAKWIRPTEIGFMLIYWYLFGYCLVWRSIPTWPLRIAFVLVSHIITMPLHVQITLSHWAMSTSDLGETESFPQRQLRTTMDVECPPWLDFIHGGLQFQAVHHLFPRVPRHNLRRLQVLVRQFCDEMGIKHSILSFTDGNKKVLSRLGEVAAQLDMMIKCQNHMAETGESGLH